MPSHANLSGRTHLCNDGYPVHPCPELRCCIIKCALQKNWRMTIMFSGDKELYEHTELYVYCSGVLAIYFNQVQ